jgi:hypothetical protein
MEDEPRSIGQKSDGTYIMETISMKAETTGMWSGMPIATAKSYYDDIYALGTLSTIHFGVLMEPFDKNGALAQSQISLIKSFDLKNPTKRRIDNYIKNQNYSLPSAAKEKSNLILNNNPQLPWLCQSLDLSVLDAQTDSVQVGAFQLNHITGNGSGEISIPFIETRNAAILNSALAIKEIMFPNGKDGGTQALPNDYLMRMTIYIYDKHSYSTKVFKVQHLVALQTGSIPLDATNRNGIGIVTLNFIKMFPMLK